MRVKPREGQWQESLRARCKLIKPERGGMERVTSQPGTVRAFEYAPLFTKVSWFQEKPPTSIAGSWGQEAANYLREIYDPERDVAAIQGQASLDHLPKPWLSRPRRVS